MQIFREKNAILRGRNVFFLENPEDPDRCADPGSIEGHLISNKTKAEEGARNRRRGKPNDIRHNEQNKEKTK